MRSVQRGIATSIILIIFLMVGVAIASAFFIFSQNQQKLKSINSFESCAKYYPVMESYPEQCVTSDGKHFVRQLSEEEKEKLKPLSEASKSSDKTANWKTYTNNKYGYSIKYPQDWILREYIDNQEVPENQYVTYIEAPKYEYAKDSYQIFSIYIRRSNNFEYFSGVTANMYRKETINNYQVLRSIDDPNTNDSVVFPIDDHKYIDITFGPYDKKSPSNHPNQQEAHQIFEKILSTFKFLK